MDFLKVKGLTSREIFKSFDVKDTRIFRTSENLVNVSNGQPWLVFTVKNFDKSVLDLQDFDLLESKFKKKLRSYNISFSKLKGLAFSLPSLLVQVSEKGKVIYNSVFITVSNVSDMKTLSLILLVSKSSKSSVLLNIHGALQKIIGCQVRPLFPSESQQYWLIGICLHETLRRDRGSSDISFRCKPRLLTTEAIIEISLLNDSLAIMWNSIPDSSKNCLELNTVNTLISAIFEHFFKTYGLNLSTSPINSFGLKDVSISFAKQMAVSIKKPEIAFSVLSYLEADCFSS